tara:strand:+ start:2597 stop:3640 length:1044 start_codon:yes stop_codon:yes gene_type:complete
MKILYAIQGTGNGHLSRAREIIPYLKKKGEVDLLVSGIQSDIPLPYDVKYVYNGMSFIFGKKGGIDYRNTYMKNHVNRFINEVKSLPIEQYDLIINDFEPISAWAAHFKKKPCISLSNQCAVLAKEAPKPKKEDTLGRFMLNNYAPTTAAYGFHFQKYADNIYTPIVRQEVRDLLISDLGHYTVYLPAHDDKRIIDKLKLIHDVPFQVFTKHGKETYQIENVSIQPINNESFLKSMASCTGVLCAAGFGTPSEALFLGKKLMVIPMKAQYEQQCNAAALKKMGVSVIKHLRKKFIPEILQWILSDEVVKVNYPNQTEEIIDRLIENEYYKQESFLDYILPNQLKVGA